MMRSGAGIPVSVYRSDSFAATGTGTIVTPVAPCKDFAIQCVGSGGTPTSWTVVVEGSVDGVTFTTLATHTNVIGAGVTVWAAAPAACRSFRANCTALVLGGATAIVAHILGMN